MKRRIQHGLGVLVLLMALAGCDYSAGTPATALAPNPTPLPTEIKPLVPTNQPAAGKRVLSADEQERRGAILDNFIKLIQTAALKPGGANFEQATKNLNQYFENYADPADYVIRPAARTYLLEQIPKRAIEDMEVPTFTRRDARHLEDCMLYHGIATRIAGAGDDLTRVRRVFDWIVRQIQLVPAKSLGGRSQAYIRPFDVLLRGMATESEGTWAERGWLFLSLCRQLGIDAGLVTYTPRGQKAPIVWICAVLIDKKAYLFDTRIGLAVPGPNGDGVATLDEALSQSVVLDRLNLPGQSVYGTTRSALAASPSKIGILIDSSPGYFSPRMSHLQDSLAGKDRTILYRDPVDQRDAFAAVLGPRFGGAKLWDLPILVENLLFTSPAFNQAIQQAQALFHPSLPLLHARMKQLRGETSEAIEEYVTIRFAENATLMDKKTPIPAGLQHILDIYATYFLALCHLEQQNAERAEPMFRATLDLLPEPGPNQPYFYMYRWGAETNLGRLNEAKGDLGQAIAYYSQVNPTPQYHGNLVLARELVWRDPTAPRPAPLPKAPPAEAVPVPGAAAVTPKAL